MNAINIDGMSRSELEQLKLAIEGAMASKPASGLTVKPSEFLDRIKAERERIAAEGKGVIHAAISDFMQLNPEVESLRWEQYTPYFNDGDACEFRVHSPEVKLAGNSGDEGDAEDGYQCSWSIGYVAKEAKQPKPPVVASMDGLKSLFEGIEGVMKAVFGDHVRVTVGRDCVAQVEEYDHD